MNKKNLKRSGIIIIMLVVLAGICWGIKLYIREKDSRWQAAKEIYLVQTALQKVDENAKLESLSEVRSFEITTPNSPTIYYYCTITAYLTEEPEETTTLNKTALSMVVDICERFLPDALCRLELPESRQHRQSRRKRCWLQW